MSAPLYLRPFLRTPRLCGLSWHLLNSLKGAVKSFMNSDLWYSDGRLIQFRNKYRGETCVVVGNGPSLNQTETHLVKGHYSFGMNRIYLGFKALGFCPTFYVSINQLVLEQCWDEIMALNMPKFLSCRYRIDSSSRNDAIFLRTTWDRIGFPSILAKPCFSKNPLLGVYEGYTVTYAAMQIAYWMGFKKVVLIGVDHNFVTKGEPNKEVVSAGTDPNHFNDGYFGKGFRWQLPDLEESEKSYALADAVFRSSGREIVDCTVGGKCPLFRKSNLGDEL